MLAAQISTFGVQAQRGCSSGRDWQAACHAVLSSGLGGLRHGGSLWLLRAGDREVVLRVTQAKWVAERATEVAALTCLARVADVVLPVPELLGYDLAEQTGYGLVLTTRVPGTSAIPAELDPERLRALGAAAARISSVKLTPAPALPARSRCPAGESSLLARSVHPAAASHYPSTAWCVGSAGGMPQRAHLSSERWAR